MENSERSKYAVGIVENGYIWYRSISSFSEIKLLNKFVPMEHRGAYQEIKIITTQTALHLSILNLCCLSSLEIGRC